MEFQVTRSLSRVLSNSRRAYASDPHLEYMVIRLLVKKRSGFWPEVTIRACADLPSSKSVLEMAARRMEIH
jgi:hypothetical protein